MQTIGSNRVSSAEKANRGWNQLNFPFLRWRSQILVASGEFTVKQMLILGIYQKFKNLTGDHEAAHRMEKPCNRVIIVTRVEFYTFGLCYQSTGRLSFNRWEFTLSRICTIPVIGSHQKLCHCIWTNIIVHSHKTGPSLVLSIIFLLGSSRSKLLKRQIP